jgi:Nuclease-related domain
LIKKARKTPTKILILEAINRRTTNNHPAKSKIKEELAISYAGFHGEQSIDYHLEFINNKTNLILQDLRLPGITDTHFQIDNLLLTQSYCLILEVKNIKGTLFFDKRFNQLIQKVGDKEIGFPDPILQINKQRSQLKYWLKKNKLKLLPILTLIIISHPSTIIKSNSDHNEVENVVIHSAALHTKIAGFEQNYQNERLTKNELHKLSCLLIKQHSEYIPNYFRKFKFEPSELLTGVHCPKCNTLPISKIRGGWLCQNCLFSSKYAFIPTLLDYTLLLGSKITNKQCRDFL